MPTGYRLEIWFIQVTINSGFTALYSNCEFIPNLYMGNTVFGGQIKRTSHCVYFFYIQTIQMGLANDVRALRMTFMGELGWELNVPTEVRIIRLCLK